MNKEDINRLAYPAMRYALGRKTYIVKDVCTALINNAKGIYSNDRYKMAEEISLAIMKNEAGMDIDVKQWEAVLKAFSEVNDD